MRSPTSCIVIAAFIFQLACRTIGADEKAHRKLIEGSTKLGKGFIHVVFTETIRSKEQRDWKDSYGASVEVFKDGQSIGKFRGSTLPNFLPGDGKPADWMYAVVQSTCAFPADLRQRYYTWTRTKRADKSRPCLRLAEQVPTLNLSSARAADMNFADILKMLGEESTTGRYLKFSEHILVHSGASQTWRGSAGCLTIHPKDAEKFFSLITEGIDGTLEVDRTIEDEATKTTHCY